MTNKTNPHPKFHFNLLKNNRIYSTGKKDRVFGCLKHIDSAYSGVPMEKRCDCVPKTQAEYNQIKAAGGTVDGGAGCSIQ
jgi:hypothetical protein